ncbi:hypothetical protein HY484_02135 [Candidatus Woesearchaeota archaeon]|nr:hypothetical protein [Candidatus Woesearchaeota archaeon]
MGLTVFNPWFTFSFLFLLVWIIIWLVRPQTRKEMLHMSIYTLPFGFTEPLFVPEYWMPPSLFNFAATTGFDIESLIFCFAIGGIGSVLYETFTKTTHKKMRKKQCHKYHYLALTMPIIVFIPLTLFTTLNPIYSAIIAMFAGAITAIICRQDITKKILSGGICFLILYFVFFFLFITVYPNIVQTVWNLQALTNIFVLGIPIEELLFAFSFGMMWSSFYEHAYRIKLQ